METTSLYEEIITRESELHTIQRKLHVCVFLGRTEEALKMIHQNEDLMEGILNCSTGFKCHLETALMRGHYELGQILLHLMLKHVRHNSVSELLTRHGIPILFGMLDRCDKQAVKLLMEALAADDPEGGGSNLKFNGTTPVKFAKSRRLDDMGTFLIDEFGFEEEASVSTGSFECSCSTNKSSGSLPTKSSSGSLVGRSNSKNRLSAPKLHIDLHIRHRSKSVSSSPRISPQASLTSLSAPQSPHASPRVSSGETEESSEAGPDQSHSGSASGADTPRRSKSDTNKKKFSPRLFTGKSKNESLSEGK